MNPTKADDFESALESGRPELIAAAFSQLGRPPTQQELSAGLRSAIQHELVPTALYVIQLGADVNHRDEYGVTPLMIAAEFLQGAVAEALLQQGAKVNEADALGQTALHRAIDSEIEFAHFHEMATAEAPSELTELLLRHGADPLAKTHNGQTPGSWAARGHVKALAALKQAIANRTGNISK